MKRPDKILMTAVLIAIALTALSINSSAATIINPPPGSEGDTLAIVAEFCPECVRMPDTDDLYFREPGRYYYVFAFEDTLFPMSDGDFNDLIVWAIVIDGNLFDWGEIASYSAGHQSFEWLFGVAVNNAHGSTAGPVLSVDWANLDGEDHVWTWLRTQQDVTAVPEPGTLGLVLIGLMALRRRR